MPGEREAGTGAATCPDNATDMFAKPSVPFHPHTFSLDAADILALPQNYSRQYLLIQNQNGGEIYVRVAAGTAPFVLAAGAEWEPRVPPSNAIRLQGSTSNQRVTLVEG